ncbi:MAG: polyprenyl synthetase family protein [Actinomycetota bacterium]|nr:polyprenyl synthetase family protein [Actinomycetota bacterium]
MPPDGPSLDELRAETDGALRVFLAERRRYLPEAAPLIDELQLMIDRGGKRLRPAFCYWGHRAAGGEHTARCIRAAASLELLHTFAIVHDDIMDASPTRRGAPSIHTERGIPVGILAGDLALVLADHLFITSGLPSECVLRAFDAYSRMRQEVIAGQYLDVRSASASVPTAIEARRLAVLKSALYTVEEPLLIGALLAGASADALSGWSGFARPLGEAFQLADDISGVFGDPGEVGKPVDSDIREGKRHLLFVYAVEGSSAEEREALLEGWGKGDALSEADVADLARLVERSGARAKVEGLIAELTAAAASALTSLDIAESARLPLHDLAARAVHPYPWPGPSRGAA